MAANIPRISLRDFDARREEIKQELLDACTTSGFFVLVDHPIPQESIDRIFDTSKRFFDLPFDVKQRTPWQGKNMGHEFRAQVRPSTGYPDPKESMQLGFGESPDGDMTKLWPAENDCPGFKAEAKSFMHQVQDLSCKVMALLAEGVGLPSDTLTKGCVCPEGSDKEDAMSTLRLIKYHELEGEPDPNYFRAGAHADFDCLTLLFQIPGQDGLEVCPGRKISTEFGYGDKWTPLKITQGEIVCNIGDQLMRWSDDRLKSTFHRVASPQKGGYMGPRYSIGFFNQARRSAVIQGPEQVYPKITGEEFIAAAMKRNYEAAMKKAQVDTYAISQETEEANKQYQISGTGLSRPIKV